jgi:hypothetical protein
VRAEGVKGRKKNSDVYRSKQEGCFFFLLFGSVCVCIQTYFKKTLELSEAGGEKSCFSHSVILSVSFELPASFFFFFKFQFQFFSAFRKKKENDRGKALIEKKGAFKGLMKLFLHSIPFCFSTSLLENGFGVQNLAAVGRCRTCSTMATVCDIRPALVLICIYSSTGAKHLIRVTTWFSASNLQRRSLELLSWTRETCSKSTGGLLKTT